MTIKKQKTTPQALIKNQITPGIHVNGGNGNGDSHPPRNKTAANEPMVSSATSSVTVNPISAKLIFYLDNLLQK